MPDGEGSYFLPILFILSKRIFQVGQNLQRQARVKAP